VHSTFFLSATQATLSTLMGWIANSAATSRLRAVDFVTRDKKRKSNTTLAMCTSTLVR